MHTVNQPQPEPLWLFDLDNTLHNASAAIFPLIDRLMQESIEQLLQVDANTADYLRQRYWQQYGATLIGLVKHHGVCAEDFLRRSHDFAISEHLQSEPYLAQHLTQLSGRKVILTNAPANYAFRVLQALGITHQFERVFSIEDMQRQQRFRPKPSRALMQQVVKELQHAPEHTIFVDDTLRNLKAAYALGMKTVHFAHPATPFSSRYAGRSAYVDLRVQSIKELSARHHQLY